MNSLSPMCRAHIEPMGLDKTGIENRLSELSSFLGYTPNALSTMARRPALLSSVLDLVSAVLAQDGFLTKELRYLIACEAARHGGSPYTSIHLAHAAHHVGATWQRVEALALDEPSTLFSDAERCLLALARPMQATDVHATWRLARQHWGADALAEAVAAISLAAWFCRWNALVDTELEREPAMALEHVSWLSRSGPCHASLI